MNFVMVVASLLAGCSEKKGEAAAEGESSKPESHVAHGTNGEISVRLDDATQKLMGLEVAPLAPTTLPAEMRGYGRVLDASSLAGSVAELATAQAASGASQAELKRLQTLTAQSNASERALQAAQATAVRDQTQVEAARLKLLAAWGPAIAGRQDLVGFVQSLSGLSNALVEVDLPGGQRLETNPTGARLFTLADQTTPLAARFLGPMPSVDPQMQSKGLLFLVESNSTHLAPGAAVTAFLTLPGEPKNGVAVPRSAIVRFNGAAWLYLQTSATNFDRTLAALEEPISEGWFVGSGLKAGDKAVVTGAQQLLSEELKEKIE